MSPKKVNRFQMLTDICATLHKLGAYVSLDIEPDKGTFSLYASTKDKICIYPEVDAH